MPVITPARIKTILAAALGAAVFVWLGLPLPLLMGPMMGCLVFALAGTKMQDLGVLGVFFRTFLGVLIGSNVTPELLHSLPTHWPTLLLIPVYILAIGAVGYPFLHKVMGFDPVTSYYAALPGGLQDMVLFGEAAGGDVRAMSLIHATRIVVIVALVPFLMAFVLDLELSRPPGISAADTPLHEIILLIVSGVAGWKIAERVGMVGASLLGPLILTAVLVLTGVITSRPPVEMIWIAQLSIGMAIGTKYSGITAKELREDVVAGFLFSLLLAALSIIFILIILQFRSGRDLDVWLSFLPGGQAEMAMIAIIAGADVGFVVAHHVLRLFTVILFAPVVIRLFRK
ncbi:MAG: AbrB family transcriptional regulator [Marinosulfonomonas sp.]|nr:AbrB family transcriptional regulator [Marinosulfonomonas sp.]